MNDIFKITKTTFIDDQYRKTRGNHSTIYSVSCSRCKSELFLYQKDGPPHTWFKRMYKDRIIEVRKGKINRHMAYCRVCGSIIGFCFFYDNHNEKRTAYRLNMVKVKKKILAERFFE